MKEETQLKSDRVERGRCTKQRGIVNDDWSRLLIYQDVLAVKITMLNRAPHLMSSRLKCSYIQRSIQSVSNNSVVILKPAPGIPYSLICNRCLIGPTLLDISQQPERDERRILVASQQTE